MKILSLIFAILLCANLFAQQKGVTPVAGTATRTGTTMALVVGVSDYQDSNIPDLKFAHRDAEEFVAWLKSKGGGSLKDDQIKLLTNGQATVAQIYSTLDWLLEASEPGDQVIIYFSGHGDVETKTVRQRGFLLAYDTPSINYRIGAIRLEDLNDILETIVQSKQAKILLITDACRSGNLAGGREGVLSTATALSTQFQNEIKIMSCQPSELSLEGEQWGGGRGVFSYHLLDGLTGMADQNNDQQITLYEIDRYLQETVPDETGQTQFPNTTGNKSVRLFSVDAAELAALKQIRSEAAQLSSIAAKGTEPLLLAGADTSIQELYEEFLTAIEIKYFLPSDLQDGRMPGRSASELYEVLSKEPSLALMQHLMKRNFAASLQDESQQAINAYLRADPEELAARWNDNIDRYKNHPAYIAKAASLLGESHILYPQLLAKQYYFEGLVKRLEGAKNQDVSLLEEALALENKALGYDSLAAYIYNEIGLIYEEIRLPYKAAGNQEKNSELFRKQVDYYEKAMELAPKWVMPVNNIAMTFTEWRRFDKAEEMAQKAIDLDSRYIAVYERLSLAYYMTGQYQKAIEANQKLILLGSQINKDWYYNLACLEALLNRPDEAIPWLEKAIQQGYGYDQLKNDSDLDNLRALPAFQALMQQYFPDKKD